MKRKRYKSPLAEMLALLDQYGPIKVKRRTWKWWQRLSRAGNTAQRKKRRRRDAARRKGRMVARRAEGLARVPSPRSGARGLGGLAGWKMLVSRMEPGAWYGFGDLVALLPEYSRDSIHAYVYQRMPAEGVLERAHVPGTGSVGEVSALVVKARVGRLSGHSLKPTKAGALKFAHRAYGYLYLYRLTSLGESLGVEWRGGG